MAYVLPVLSAIGGGSAATGAVVLATAAVGTYAAIQTKKAGDAASSEAKGQAVREADDARGREIQRRRNLVKSLAEQNAFAGATGQSGGSLQAIARSDIRDANNDLLTDTVNSQARQRVLRSQGSNAQTQGNVSAVKSLFDTGTSIYGMRGGRGLS